MPTITVPSGGGGSVSLTFATSASASLATSLLSAVYAAQGNLSSLYVDTSTGASTVFSSETTVIDAASGVVSLTGNGGTGELIVAGSTNFSYTSMGGTGTIIAGAGTDTFNAPNYAILGDETYQAAGATSVSGSNYQDTLVSSTTPGGVASVSAAGTNGFIFGSGSGNNLIANTGTNTSVVINATATTVNAGGSGLYFSASGSLLFVNSGASTVVGSGTGAATLFGGNTAMLYFQGTGTGSTEFVNGSGNSVLVTGTAGGLLAFNGAGGTLNLDGTSSTAFNYLVGGGGSETLNAAFSGGTAVLVGGPANALAYLSNSSQDGYFGGSGSSTIVGGTTTSGSSTVSLPDLYAFANGSSGGSDLILNFSSTDGLVFLGYGTAGDASIKSAIAAAGSGGAVSFTLPDSTKITLIGINGATVNPSTAPTFYS